jgi:putative transcriptional regulator
MTRDIFAELVEGFDALADERGGKVTLRSHKAILAHWRTGSRDVPDLTLRPLR